MFACSLKLFAQIRWKTSVPRTLIPPPGPVAIHRTTMVVGLTKRPNQTALMLQSEGQSLEVWNRTRRPLTPPAMLYGTTGHGLVGALRKTPLKSPPTSTHKTFKSAPRSLRQTDGDKSCAQVTAVDTMTRNNAAMSRDICFSLLLYRPYLSWV